MAFLDLRCGTDVAAVRPVNIARKYPLGAVDESVEGC
jgi:hypothetical protein